MQLELALPATATTREPLTIEERFSWFHAHNPQVYRELVRLARNARRRGVQRVGIGMLWEVLRWEIMLGTADFDPQGPALNNDYRSRYARLIMETEPELADLFEVRELRTE